MADVIISDLMKFDAIQDALDLYHLDPTEEHKRAVISQIAEDVLDAAESDAEIFDEEEGLEEDEDFDCDDDPEDDEDEEEE